MFLGDLTFKMSTNDRYLMKTALELLKQNTEMLYDKPEEQQWAKQRAQYWIRMLTER